MAHKLARRQIGERKKNTFTPFKKDEKVWLDTQNLKMTYHKKMALKREGPFEIEEVIDIQVETPKRLENPQHLLCNVTQTLF